MRVVKTPFISAITMVLLAGSAVGVAAQDDPMAPAAVTGTALQKTQESGGTPTMVEAFGMLREGLQFTSTWEASDPRLSGESTITGNAIGYSEQQMEVGSGDSTLENDGGRWVGRATVLAGYPFGTTETHILQGEDAYAGLTAYVVIERAIDDSGPGYTLGAAIFPGEMP